MNNKTHLKPCPFCGSKKVELVGLETITVQGKEQTHVIIQCNGCNVYAGVPFDTEKWAKDCNYKEEAADYWNRRSKP